MTMEASTRKRLDTILAEREARERHAALVRKQLAEEREARRLEHQRRAVRGLASAGFIR